MSAPKGSASASLPTDPLSRTDSNRILGAVAPATRPGAAASSPATNNRKTAGGSSASSSIGAVSSPVNSSLALMCGSLPDLPEAQTSPTSAPATRPGAVASSSAADARVRRKLARRRGAGGGAPSDLSRVGAAAAAAGSSADRRIRRKAAAARGASSSPRAERPESAAADTSRSTICSELTDLRIEGTEISSTALTSLDLPLEGGTQTAPEPPAFDEGMAEDFAAQPGAYMCSFQDQIFDDLRAGTRSLTSRVLSVFSKGADIQVEAVVVNDDEVKETILQEIMEQTVMAEKVEIVKKSNDRMSEDRKRLIIGTLVMIAIVSLSVVMTRQSRRMGAPLTFITPMLQNLTKRGVLRCGVRRDSPGFSQMNRSTGKMGGLSIDLCRAVAAAALGTPDGVEFVFIDFKTWSISLSKGAIDVIIAETTHTLERDVYEPTAKEGFSFSVPYHYTGLSFGGIPFFQACAENLMLQNFDNVGNNCSDLKICVEEGTTWMQILKKELPPRTIQGTSATTTSIEGFMNGICNVIAAEPHLITDTAVRQAGYEGSYALGSKTFSKEPLAMVTRDNDPEWTDFVNWVLLGLFRAEELNFTRRQANETNCKIIADEFLEFSKSGQAFGDEYETMFCNSVSAVGNFRELNERNLDKSLARHEVNKLNTCNGNSGLMYFHPFGATERAGPGPNKKGKLEMILQRGHLECGITFHDYEGFGTLDAGNGKWSGLDVDFCKALSAAIFQGDVTRVNIVGISDSEESFVALTKGTVDVLSGASLSFQKDVGTEPSKSGFFFTQPIFYGMENGSENNEDVLTLATLQDDPQWSDFVYWLVTSAFYAEEHNISQHASNEMPKINLFGPDFHQMLCEAILAVGHYGEMYERNLKLSWERGGCNLLNRGPNWGPQHHPLPLGGTMDMD